jgi:hypothetical protein
MMALDIDIEGRWQTMGVEHQASDTTDDRRVDPHGTLSITIPIVLSKQ